METDKFAEPTLDILMMRVRISCWGTDPKLMDAGRLIRGRGV
jgi:hypothetical protein